ncbi:hypothetical protein O2W14_17355 [Modestobacter sp. VKM Ac-2986]|uniref:hypothetical protein n=1 Tax=Modestobacter sp. VKM Ac-2986 TaxID=3004140 RepID=UPI0022AB6274|nr:hypothetical protein [Modestobacter sp. VKM Ac-2986]MCZ2830607.1 hypothetical protein [Modestobacter sp. VKM Ac-2986]
MPRRRPPTEDDGTPRRPTVVVLMAEHGGGPLWNRSPRHQRGWNDYVVDPVELGVSPGLVAAMDEWNDEYGRHSSHDPDAPEDPVTAAAWLRRGLTLAYRLQQELGEDVEVRYHDDTDERPVRGRRGP